MQPRIVMQRQGKLFRKFGIQETLIENPGRPAVCTIKSTYADFIVQEVSAGGEVAAFPTEPSNPLKNESYHRFVLYKQGLTTSAALDLISKSAGVKYELFKTSGMKDRHATATQFVTVKSEAVDLKRLKAVGNTCHPRVAIGNFSSTSCQQTRGEIKGNRFTVVLREVAANVSPEGLARVVSDGFINYFGLQRFGARPNVGTPDLGLCIYRRDWKRLAQLLLGPRGENGCDMERGRLALKETGDAHKALSRMPTTKGPERDLMRALARRYPKGGIDTGRLTQADCEALIMDGIGIEDLKFFCAGYQALIWNRTASALVCSTRGAGMLKSRRLSGERISAPEKLRDAATGLRNLDIPLLVPNILELVHDQHTQRQLRNWLSKDGVDEKALRYVQDVLGVIGSMRPLVVCPENFSAHWVEPGQPLVDDKLQRELGMSTDLKPRPNASSRPAMRLTFTLPPGSYATMCIREALYYTAHYASSQQRVEHNQGDDGV